MKRVIQFATGNVGKHALPLIIERPGLELVGLHAHGPDKVGRDAADICGRSEPTGVIATKDIDALVALGADCVVYTSQAEMRPQQAIEEICRFLRAGTNVVGTSMVWLVAPQHADAWIREPLAAACAEGGTSLYINGVDPGYSGDSLVYTALTLAGRATGITVSEICDYGSYDDAEFTGVSFGFGTTPDHTPIMFAPGVLSSLWGGQVRSLADVLGVTLDEVRESHESWVTPEPIDCTMMSVAPGHVAAVRFAVEGIRDGQPVITMEHVNRLTPITAPDWPYPPDGRLGVHRVVVHGNPGVEINTRLGLDGVDHNDGGVISTAARAVNAIDAVCAAPSGLLSVKDLPAAHADRVMW
ncbi:dihydrodipicolinate reductase [Mycolicibacterium aromaticivorans JS19b1 = JCM 16368]|uniref:Dihydrodipicolinate reductase n=1 Tax=Mycolicibacterium aromaticivorans JS19b1 = JCM 16368 TaxID=1440774 RepID=A0A064CBL9_9MYCO|nr:dihydrodipicolinate reductase [Mycolicibacterium aromaticivorans]KDE97725.1 dihydrodipicolinate reductase [Mycolicibacterium aromaticivorans JS19b1 = JCM 16368]